MVPVSEGIVPDPKRQKNSGSSPDNGLETTAALLSRVRSGDEVARDRLITRYMVALKRWAHGRLPARARDLLETDDLEQITLIRALDNVEGFEPRREGAFLAYLRRILVNQIRDEIRRVSRRPARDSLSEGQPDEGPSPVEAAIGREKMALYEKALATLSGEQQEAIIMRLELGFTYEQVAEALGSPSGNAARMLVTRAVVKLEEALDARG